MKYSITVFITILLGITSILPAEAQLDQLRRAGKTLGNKVANKTIEKGSEKAADAISDKLVEAIMDKIMKGESIEGDTTLQDANAPESKKTGDDALGKLGTLMGTSSEKVDKQYHFDYEVVQKITAEEGSNSIVQLLPENGNYLAFEISSIKIITDFETDESYTIINDRLSSYNMDKYTESPLMNYEIEEEGSNAKYTVTDEYATIAGYRSRLHLSESEEGEAKLWISNSFIKNPYLSDAEVSKLGDDKSLSGYPMKMEFTDPEGNKSTMEVVSVIKKAREIDLSKM